MKNFRIFLLLSFALLLSGCFDRGSRNADGECGMKANSQQVAGYNGQICKENSEYQAFYMLMPDTVVSMLNDTDEAKTGIPNLMKENKTLSYFSERFAGMTKILQEHISDVGIWLIVIYLIYSMFQSIFEAMKIRNPIKDEALQQRFTYRLLGWNYLKFALVLVLIAPIGFDGNPFYSRYATGTPFKIGQENLAFTVSTYTSAHQQGKVESSPLSLQARAYSSVNWLSWSLNNMLLKGKLRDNKTAKVEYSSPIMIGGKYTLPVEHDSSEPYIFRTNGKIELKRYTIVSEAYNQIKARSQLSFSGKVTFNNANITSRAATNLIASSPDTYLSSQPSEIPAKAQAMIAGMVSVYGEDIKKKPDELNRAIIYGVIASMPNLIEAYMIKEQPTVAEATRLVEELLCTQTPINPEIKYNNERFIRNVTAGKLFESDMINKCVGQNGSKYISYGQRNYNVVEAELDKKYAALVSRGYEYLVSIVAASKDITINDETAEYCKKARVGGLRGAILYTDKCLYDNKLQADLTDYITNSFIAESVGYDHYIDSEFRVNDSGFMHNPSFNDDYDQIMEKLFRTIPVKVTQGQVSQEAYLRGMADSYDEKESGTDSLFNMFHSPIETLKASIDLDKEKPDPIKVKQGIQKMLVKGVSLGTTMFLGGMAASGIDNALEMNKDKSRKTDVGYSGKGTSKMGFLASKFVKMMSALQTPGLIIGVGSVMGLLFFALPKIIFIFLAFHYVAHVLMMMINGVLTVVKFARLDDKDNFIFHGNKLFNNIMYIILTPVILLSMFLMVTIFEGEAMVYSGMQLMKIQTHTLMDSIAFVCLFVVTIGVMTQAVLATAITCMETMNKEMFGESQTPSSARFALQTAMFIVKWSLPIVGLVLHLFSKRQR